MSFEQIFTGRLAAVQDIVSSLSSIFTDFLEITDSMKASSGPLLGLHQLK